MTEKQNYLKTQMKAKRILLFFSPPSPFIKDHEKSTVVNIIYGAPNKNAMGK